jgi:hypothetical protein
VFAASLGAGAGATAGMDVLLPPLARACMCFMFSCGNRMRRLRECKPNPTTEKSSAPIALGIPKQMLAKLRTRNTWIRDAYEQWCGWAIVVLISILIAEIADVALDSK